MDEEILAKSPIPGRPPKTLLGHTQEIMRAVELLYGTEGRPTTPRPSMAALLPAQRG